MRQAKVCTKCGELKPLSEFYAMKEMRDGHRNDCIECNKAAKRERHAANPEPHRQRARQWALDNPELVRAYQRDYRQRPEVKRRARAAYYLKAYGISLEEAEATLERQGHRCAICRREMPERIGSMHLDHCHQSGAIRAFLCIDCNHGLGKFCDDPALLRAAAEYVERYRGTAA
jgi:hypothetical protein